MKHGKKWHITLWIIQFSLVLQKLTLLSIHQSSIKFENFTGFHCRTFFFPTKCSIFKNMLSLIFIYKSTGLLYKQHCSKQWCSLFLPFCQHSHSVSQFPDSKWITGLMNTRIYWCFVYHYFQVFLHSAYFRINVRVNQKGWKVIGFLNRSRDYCLPVLDTAEQVGLGLLVMLLNDLCFLS